MTPVSGSVYDVDVNTGTGDGTIRLDLDDDDSITDTAGNELGSTGANNGDHNGDQTFTIDRTPPTVSSINRVGSNPTNASSVSWTVEFSEDVTGVGTGGFSLAVTGLGGSPGITSVTPVDGDTYTVTATTGTGDGTLGLNLVDDDSIQDAATNKLGGTRTGNAVGFAAGRSRQDLDSDEMLRFALVKLVEIVGPGRRGAGESRDAKSVSRGRMGGSLAHA